MQIDILSATADGLRQVFRENYTQTHMFIAGNSFMRTKFKAIIDLTIKNIIKIKNVQNLLLLAYSFNNFVPQNKTTLTRAVKRHKSLFLDLTFKILQQLSRITWAKLAQDLKQSKYNTLMYW